MTIQELAKLAGVSTATVSRVFNHHPVREEIRRKIFDLAKKHHYLPRISTRQKNVVVLTPSDALFPAHSCVDMLLLALAQTFPKRGFRLEILPVNNLERLAGIPFCGAVAIGLEASEFSGWDERFATPLVVVDRYPENGKMMRNIYFVHSDEIQAMQLAIDHLYVGGCRKIGCIVHGTPEKGNARIRFEAIADALKRHGLPCERMLCYAGNGTEKYVELIGKMLRYGADALFCPGGNAGLMALYALSLYGKKIPDDIALIASEQTAFSRYTVPPQTTFSPDYRKIAETVADVFDGKNTQKCVSLPCRLIVRESTPETGEAKVPESVR